MKKTIFLLFAVAALLSGCGKNNQGNDNPPILEPVYAYDPIGDIVALVKQISMMNQTDANTFLVNQGWKNGEDVGESISYVKKLDCGSECILTVNNDPYYGLYAVEYGFSIENIQGMPAEYAMEAINSLGTEIAIRDTKLYYTTKGTLTDDVAAIGMGNEESFVFDWKEKDFNWKGGGDMASISAKCDTTTQEIRQLSITILLPNATVETLDVPYKFGFDGLECMVLSGDSVSQEDYLTKVAGYGWKSVCANEIRTDGSVIGKIYWSYMVGGGPTSYFVDADSVVSFFTSWDIRSCHSTTATRFSNSIIQYFIQDKWQSFITLIEVNGDELLTLRAIGYIPSENRNVYILEKYHRMTDSELEEYRTLYNEEP